MNEHPIRHWLDELHRGLAIAAEARNRLNLQLEKLDTFTYERDAALRQTILHLPDDPDPITITDEMMAGTGIHIVRGSA